MANSNLTIDMITFKCLDILELASPLIRNINKQYDKSFAVQGAKIGDTLRVRKPDRCLVTKGAALGVADDNEQFTNVSITEQDHVGLNFTTAELALNIDDFAERKLKPRISQLAASVESKIASVGANGFYQSVGTPGTTPATSLVLLQGGVKLNDMNVDLTGRTTTVNPAANAALVEGMKGFFNPTGTISKQFKSGMMGENILGFDSINMGQGITTHLNGDWGTTITSTGTLSTQGQATLPISFTGSSKDWNEGDVFTIAGVYSVNPQTRVSTGSLQQFVVTADVTASTTGTLAINPPIYTAEHALATVDSFPQATAVVTMLGTAATAYPQNLMCQQNAMTLSTADLVMPQGVDMASRQNHNGISIRIVKQYDINNDRLPCRLDILYGVDILRHEMGVRLWG